MISIMHNEDHKGGVDGQSTGVDIRHLGQTGNIVRIGLKLVDGDVAE